ncbi:MAG TPA: Mur ligase family protein [Opitutales bacterium]|nr:Mur ligase family protein [Opitutales bacterium]
MRIYFMGICGTAMGNAALLMRQCGHEVLGADTGVYPPMSTTLEASGIRILEGYSPERLEKLAPDLVVVGNAHSRGHPEVEWLLNERKIAFTSVPELLNRFILSARHNIVVSGTHGKTTTSAMTAFLLSQTGHHPGWLVGGVPRDLPSGAELGGVNAPFVIEGDEYDSAFFDKRSKFIHYNPRILIVNNVEMDHADIFRDFADVLRTFRHVSRIVPGRGWILLNGDDEGAKGILPCPWTQVLTVGVSEGCGLRLADFSDGPSGASFKLLWKGRTIPVKLAVNGLFNARNAAMAILSSALAVTTAPGELPELETHAAAIATFVGVHRRQEVLVDTPKVVAIEDFGHHPTAIACTLDALRAHYPGRRTVAVFEPRSNTAVTNLFQKDFTAALAHADVALIGHVHRAEKLAADKRLDTAAMAAALVASGREALAATDNAQILARLAAISEESAAKPALVVFFSNGSFDGIIGRFAETARMSR